MKRKYEGLVVFNTKGQEGSVEELTKEIGQLIEAEGAELDEIQQLGRRKFAHNARQVQGGHYVNFIFNAEPEAINKIKASLDLADNIYMHQYRRSEG